MLDYKEVISHLYQARAMIAEHCIIIDNETNKLMLLKALATIDRNIQSIEKQTKKILFSPEGQANAKE